MKKIKYLIILFFVFILTGCVKYNTEMKINDDDSVELTMTYSLQTQQNDEIAYSNTKINKNDFEFLKNYGFSIEDFDENLENGTNISGLIIYKKFKSLQDMTSNEKLILDFTKIFQKEDKNFEYDKFFYKDNGKLKANYIFDFRAENDDNMDYNQYSKLFDLKYSISFPESIIGIESNASEKSNDGHKLTWNMELGKVNEITFSFSSKNVVTDLDKKIILVCLGIIGASTLIIIIVLLTKINDRKKINIADEENLNEEQ